MSIIIPSFCFQSMMILNGSHVLVGHGWLFYSMPHAFQSQHEKVAENFTKAFLQNSIPKMTPDAIENIMLHRAVVLEYTRTTNKGKKKKAKGLNAKERRRLKIFQLKPEHQKWVPFSVGIISVGCNNDILVACYRFHKF